MVPFFREVTARAESTNNNPKETDNALNQETEICEVEDENHTREGFAADEGCKGRRPKEGRR
jgi:hypothetical protein